MKPTLLATLLTLLLTGLVGAAEVSTAAVDQDPAVQALETQVRELIEQKQDYNGAMMAYAKAAKADPSSQYYRDQFALLRRVIKMQKALKTESNVEKWKSYAQAVRAYFYAKGFYDAALALDNTAYEKSQDIVTGTQKLESLLITRQNDEAAALSKSLGGDGPARLKTLRPVALACNGKAADALAAVAEVKIDPRQDPTPLFDLARIHWAAGKQDDAYTLMRLFLEHTVPSELGTSKHMLTGCPDFAALQDQAAFKTVLATESKVAQSGCSGGSSCGSCSLKGGCSASQ